MSEDGIFVLFFLWCLLNTVLILFAFNKSRINKIEKNLKEADTKFTGLVGATIDTTKELLFDRVTQSIMIRLRKENYIFPFDVYEFNSDEFAEVSRFLQNTDDTFRENFTNIPDRYIIMKELVLPFFRDNWKEERFTMEFANFVKRHNMQGKEKKQ